MQRHMEMLKSNPEYMRQMQEKAMRQMEAAGMDTSAMGGVGGMGGMGGMGGVFVCVSASVSRVCGCVSVFWCRNG